MSAYNYTHYITNSILLHKNSVCNKYDINLVIISKIIFICPHKSRIDQSSNKTSNNFENQLAFEPESVFHNKFSKQS